MSAPIQRKGWSWPVRVAVGLAAAGGMCIVASILVAYLVADHSSSDSSPSSLMSIGLVALGLLLVLLGAVLFTGIALGRLWRGHRRPPHGIR